MSREERFVLVCTAGIAATTIGWWGLALWPLAAGAPEWLVRTRYACFGVQGATGPGVEGWLALVLQPVSMSAGLFIGWTDGCRAVLRRLASRRGRRGVAITAAVVLTAVAAGADYATRTESRGVRSEARVRTTPRPAGRVDLIDQSGARFDAARLSGRPALVTFAYAQCETVCPFLVSDVLQAQRTLVAAGKPVTVVIVTLDPWRDTVRRLPHIAREWRLPSDAYVLSGSPHEVERVLRTWDVGSIRSSSTGGIAHVPEVRVLDRNGRQIAAISADVSTLVEFARRI